MRTRHRPPGPPHHGQETHHPQQLAALLTEDVPDSLSGVTRTVPATDPLTALDALIGLRDVKREVHRLVAEARAAELRRAAGQPARTPSRHLLFTGNPGTAKTTVARLVAALYAQLGLLSSGHLVEAHRGDLIAPYLGQTAPKVRAAVEQALGGVLFIDEAYALTGDDYGREAVATLVKLMEEYRGDLVVIAAGYEREMSAFLASDPGLESRFAKRLRFPDYSTSELIQIFEHLAAADGLTLAPDVPAALRRHLMATNGSNGSGHAPADGRAGNGRHMRNLLDTAIATQAQRLTPSASDSEIITLRASDLPEPSATPAGYGLYL
ncbi:AAA family ATPase [Actinomadura yumaensis]|uniref:AAA family ATPase n=1 Tax=Actinomadura yumaensis TaxID=111807 RepID=UPI003622F380